MAPLHYLLAPDVQLLYAQGISHFLAQQLGVRVLINPPPKNTKIKVHYLIVIDRALSWKKAKTLFDWQRNFNIVTRQTKAYGPSSRGFLAPRPGAGHSLRAVATPGRLAPPLFPDRPRAVRGL